MIPRLLEENHCNTMKQMEEGVRGLSELDPISDPAKHDSIRDTPMTG
jgi:hypothetical protein